jgi:hypothetical protein
MSQPKGDEAFVDAIPEVYERLLVPLIFESYAVDLARRVADASPLSVLEIAAGTGVLTRQLAALLPDNVPATAMCLGTPLRNEIEARDRASLAAATDGVASAIAERFGAGTVDGKMQARVFSVSR